MRPVLLSLLLLIAPALADARAPFLKARDTLQKADYEELATGERDELFAAVVGWDHPDAVRAVSDVVSRYGLYLDILEAKMRATQEKLQPMMNKSAMTDQQISLRNSYLRKMKKYEAAWREALASLEKLVVAMGQWQEEKSLATAVAFMPTRPTWRVRQVAALACAEWHKNVHEVKTTKKLFKTLQKLAKDKEPRVRRAVARSLASFRRMEALPVLKACLNDGDWRVRAAAIETVKKNPSDETVDMLVMRLPKEKGRLEDDIVKFLQEISGEKFQFSEEWVGWWKGKGRRIPPKGSTTDPNARVDPNKKQKVGHRFYGIRSRSKGVVYIIDMSGSMKKEVEDLKSGPVTGRKASETRAAGKTRWQVA
ncbi:MAG: HEAT repeat domain-containing protein, partial [Planctomycetota bacterium]